jgi:hypothetical protein
LDVFVCIAEPALTTCILAVRQKWANVSPSDETATRKGWMMCALENPVAFYALAFAASQHHNYLLKGNDPHTGGHLIRLSYKTSAIKLINEQINFLDGRPIPDHLLIAILSMGAHGHKPLESSDAKQSAYMDKVRGPKSPLASAQMIDFYGHMDQETAHMSALRTLLAHNKGIAGIKLPGLAGALELGDLLHSTITHQKPGLRAGRSVADLPEIAQFLPLDDEETFAPMVTFPLRHASSLPDNTPSTKLLNILTLAQTVTTALTHYQNQNISAMDPKSTAVSIRQLILARNYVHHSMLSLPEANSLWGSQFALYNVLRITALIYSDLVLFPLPKQTGVRGRYAAMLREVLQGKGSGVGGLWCDEAALMLWACLMGAVAAAEVIDVNHLESINSQEGMTPKAMSEEVARAREEGDWQEERTWFVAKVRMCAEMLNLGLAKGMDGWEEIKDRTCTRFLWWDDVCDIVGRGVWEEVVLLQNVMLDAGLGKPDG